MESYAPSQPAQPVIQQPVSHTTIQINTGTTISNPLLPRGIPRPWSSEWAACCDDMPICLCTTFVPCYPCCMAADMNESCMFPMCAPGGLIAMRAIIRGRHNIQGNLCNDCMMMTCCNPCAMCQLAREVQNIKSGMAIP